jgi:hypothetical protein
VVSADLYFMAADPSQQLQQLQARYQQLGGYKIGRAMGKNLTDPLARYASIPKPMFLHHADVYRG